MELTKRANLSWIEISLSKRLSIASQTGGNCVCFRRCYKWCITPKPRRSWPCRGPICHFCCYDCGWRDFKCYRNKLWKWNKHNAERQNQEPKDSMAVVPHVKSIQGLWWVPISRQQQKIPFGNGVVMKQIKRKNRTTLKSLWVSNCLRSSEW